MENFTRMKYRSYVMLVVLFTLLSSCDETSDSKVIKLAHGLDVSHPVHKAMVFMQDRLDEKSKGTLRLEIYPNQQLGTEREVLELLQIGSLGMTKVSTSTLENFVPELRILGLPFLFRDRDHKFAVLEGEIGEHFLNASIDSRLKGLTFYDAGSRSFYTKTKVETPEDLSGMKIRVMETYMAINMVRSMGGSPTPISWGELYTALQQGIVDGAENNLPSFYLSRHYEICKYYILDEHTAVPDEIVVSTILWNSLTDLEKIWLKEAAVESAQYQKKIWREAELEALRELEKNGVEILTVDKELFRSKTDGIYTEFAKDPQLKILIDQILEVK